MSDPFRSTVAIPEGTNSVLLGQHTNKRDLKSDFHVILDDVVLCSGERQPFPSTYQRVTRETMKPGKLPMRCGVCRDALSAWAGHPEWVEGEVS